VVITIVRHKHCAISDTSSKFFVGQLTPVTQPPRAPADFRKDSKICSEGAHPL